MKLPCEVVRDLLPLYTEDMVSPESRKLTEEHLAECAPCRETYKAMGAKIPDVQFRMDTAKEFAKYEKKKKLKLAALIAGVTAAAVFLILFLILFINSALLISVIGFVILHEELTPVQTDTDPSHYSMYMGEEALSKYRNKWDMDESVFPAELTDDMEVFDYKMVYYDCWDAQYLSYLTVTYSPDDYAAELGRLEDCGVTPYLGIYGVTGFAEPADPIAMFADDYNGFVYAIHTPEKENTITYVELIFCNYCFDLDYKEYIPSEYLPLGFDATMNNPYGKRIQKN